MDLQTLQRQIHKDDLLPIYFIYGEEQFLAERVVRSILEKAVEPATRDFNLNIYYGADCRGTEIADTVKTLPMFAKRRVVLVKQAEKLPATAQEHLLTCLTTPNPETCLIFMAVKPDLRRKLFSELKKSSGSIEFKKLYENKLAPFINTEVSTHGKKIEAAAVDLLIFLVGNNLQELVSQIEKTCLYIGDKKIITLADLRTIASQSKTFSSFELARYIGEKNLSDATITLQSMLQNNEEAPMIIGALASHFRRIWRIRELLDQGKNAAQIAAELKISNYFIKDLMLQAKKHSTKELKVLFERLFNADLSAKTGSSAATILHNLVYETCAN